MANLIIWTTLHADHAPIRGVAGYHLASWLRQHGYTVEVIDFSHLMTTDQLVDITEKYIGSDTIAVGVSSTFWDSFWKAFNTDIPVKGIEPEWVVKAREKIQSRHPNLKWLLGGSKAVRKIFQFEWIKFPGFAEDDLLRWMDQNSGKFLRRDLFSIQTTTKSFQPSDFIQPNEVIPIDLGRGCMFKCKFCSYPLIGKKPGTYLRDPNFIREEIIRNYNEWGTTKYYFQDDTVNESPEKVKWLADIAQSLQFKIDWVGYTRLDLIQRRPETIQMLKDSGLRSAYFGIESFHPQASMAIGKGWNGKYAKDFLLELKELWGKDINWFVSCITGLPGEPREHLEEVAQWLIDNKMYEWTFFGLNIDITPSKYWKSEFELDYAKYGYSFPDPKRAYYWEREGWNAIEADRVARELNIKCRPHYVPSTWLLAELTTFGKSFEELMFTKKTDIDWDDYRQKTKDFVNVYVGNKLA